MKAFHLLAEAMKVWLRDKDTDPDLVDCIMQYVKGRGSISMREAVEHLLPQYRKLGIS